MEWLDGLKDRFSSKNSRSGRSRRSDRYADDEYDDYGQEDFGEYTFDDNADYAQLDSDSTGELYSSSMPRLVTADDVRSHTQYTPSDNTNTQPAHAAQDYDAYRNNDSSSTSGSYNSTGTPQAQRSISASETGALSMNSRTVPSDTAPTANPVSEPRIVQRATRMLTVISPESYAEAERIAKILKSGDVAVLSLRKTPDALGKRILDFSFGVACALDARVECVSGHVFAITRGAGLTDGETARLRDQGLM